MYLVYFISATKKNMEDSFGQDPKVFNSKFKRIPK